MSDAELFKVTNPGMRILPLLPDKASKTPENPGFQGLQYVPRFDQAVIIPPSPEVHIQFLDHPIQALPTAAAGQLTDCLLKPFDGFRVKPYF